MKKTIQNNIKKAITWLEQKLISKKMTKDGTNEELKTGEPNRGHILTQ